MLSLRLLPGFQQLSGQVVVRHDSTLAEPLFRDPSPREADSTGRKGICSALEPAVDQGKRFEFKFLHANIVSLSGSQDKYTTRTF